MKKLKILHIAGHDSLKSGTPILMSRIAAALSDEKHDVFCGFEKGNEESILNAEVFKNKNITFRFFDISRIGFNIKTLKNILKIRKFFKKEKFDIVHVHDSLALDNVIIATIGMKINLVVSRGFMKPISYFRSFKYKSKKVKKIIAVSEAVKNKMLENNYIKKDKIEVFHGVMDIKKYSKNKILRRELKIDDAKYIIGNVGNESEIKGTKYLVKSFEKICIQYPNIVLVLAGISKSFIDNMKLQKPVTDKIFALGFRNDVCKCLGSFDLFVYPGIGEEAMGLVIAEAQLSKVPAIITNSGGAIELVENKKSGIIIEKKNINQMSESIKELIGNKEMANEYANKSYNFAIKTFSPKLAIKNIEKIYYECIGN